MKGPKVTDPFVAVGSYSGDPSASTRDAVRFEVGDVGPVFALTDAEVAYALARAGSVLLAAADAADAMAGRFARQAESETNGDMAVSWGKRSENMAKIAVRLRSRAMNEIGSDSGPVNLGLADTREDVGPFVWRGMHDNPAAPGPDVR
jgi:hypothetical protein